MSSTRFRSWHVSSFGIDDAGAHLSIQTQLPGVAQLSSCDRCDLFGSYASRAQVSVHEKTLHWRRRAAIAGKARQHRLRGMTFCFESCEAQSTHSIWLPRNQK